MNLLIEQRPTTITSNLQPQSHVSSTQNEVNASSSPLVLKLKRHTANQQENDLRSTSSSSSSSAMDNDDDSHSHARSTPTNQRLKRITTTTATRRSTSPAFNGKQQASKRSVTIDSNNNDLTAQTDEISASSKRFKSDEFNSSIKVDASVETVSIGLATEPDHLGPCEPGTSVVLEGIVWNETDSGVLVVNVTWRGKTYVGTLLDSTKQDWACPRLICESPTSDYDPRHSSKTNRTKRNSTTNNHSRCPISSAPSHVIPSALDDRKLRNTIKTRQSKRTNPTDDAPNNGSSPLVSPFQNNVTFFSSDSSTQESKLIPCTEPHCHKRFASAIALNYHVSDAHRKRQEPPAPPPPPSLPTIPQPSTRDEEDVAHILVNVAEYVRRSSPPYSKRASPEHPCSTTLTWPCRQISSSLVLSSPLNNTEQTSSSSSQFNHHETSTIDHPLKSLPEHEELKPVVSTVKPADHFLLHIQDEPLSTAASSQAISSPPLPPSQASWIDTKARRTSAKTPTPPPSSFIPIQSAAAAIVVPPTSSSPAYSDISDEDSTINNENERVPPSTINLLAATNDKLEDTEPGLLSSTRWTTQMLLQQYGSYMQQQTLVGPNAKDSTSNRLNSKHYHSSSSPSNGTSDSTVKNILDARRLSTSKSSSTIANDSNSSLADYPKGLYHYHTNGTGDALLNTLTSPNENLLNPSSSNPLDFSLNTSASGSSR